MMNEHDKEGRAEELVQNAVLKHIEDLYPDLDEDIYIEETNDEINIEFESDRLYDLIDDEEFCRLIDTDKEDILWSNNYALFDKDITTVTGILISVQLDNKRWSEEFNFDVSEEEGHKIFEQFQKTKGFDKAVEEARDYVQELEEEK